MISASRAGLNRSAARRGRRCSVHESSGMIGPRDEIHGVHKRFPRDALPGEHAPSFGRQTVEAPSPLSYFLDPTSLQPSALFQSIQKRIQRRDVELQLPARARLDELADLVSVTWTRFKDRENDELCRSLFQLAVEHARLDRCHSHICYCHRHAAASDSWSRKSRESLEGVEESGSRGVLEFVCRKASVSRRSGRLHAFASTQGRAPTRTPSPALKLSLLLG